MKYLLSKAYVFSENKFKKCDVLIDNGIIVSVSPDIPVSSDVVVFNFNNCFVLPGLIDVHVHLREPGFFYKETIDSGTMAAARGGYTAVCSMPNLNPVPDCAENLSVQLDLIKKSANVNVYPYAAITKGENGRELSDMDALAADVIAFSDDGRGVQSESMMLDAMQNAGRLGKIIVAHCEDNSLLHGGYIHDGEYAAAHGHRGICSASEYKPIERDLELAKRTGCAYHVCHISTRQSVEAIRRAKADGVDVTCETAPHYLVLCDKDLQEDGRFKMNPPLRSEDDRAALIEGICDGTIDMIATDHAPHSAEEKSKGLEGSAFGIVGLETAFPILYTHLVKTGVITMEKLAELMNVNPSKRFKIKSGIKVGNPADLAVFNVDDIYEINSADFASKGKSTPFDGAKVYGKCEMTMVNGRIIWQDSLIKR